MHLLDQSSVIPLYHQLKQILFGKIQSGEWKPGDKIDSENQLMEMFHVSRNTVKKAIEELVKEDKLYRIQGKGTFVSKPRLEQSLGGFYSFSRMIQEKGFNQKDEVLEIQKVYPSTKVRSNLALEENEQVVEMKRLRFADNEPIILESSFLPLHLIKDTEILREVTSSSLYSLLAERFNIIVVRAREAFEPVLINKDEAPLLKTDAGKPALLLERTAFDTSGKPVEFCISIVRGDRCRFYTELN
ncbi:GntR family transcriptional regulator [Lysinibacillus fusiformis]|jgi:GntR family transcriptional regulator|uniref:GntR family transcriptional regulator n=1 Tax=Lysinibacillus TaxID=400634 RepID=UPI0004DAC97E|nr:MULTISPECIES: GntR family transcriptional regulator [Lysinibacillus]MDC6268402.1 GntR family transcriptional regulator [Lysinibacillus sphaericus]AJK89247.1 GntR family transcriptional regulator [Lysinibacillus fusiformis]KAB0442116.1 GntR family transcriptional regulator [Lysinibacillus fusiformis]KGA82519.1 GntR family transcriptional regulator [Lysinibacillus fusiformis]KHK52315.1 GntR family transcriptional regulator [Lysinibacillus sp. A1]